MRCALLLLLAMTACHREPAIAAGAAVTLTTYGAVSAVSPDAVFEVSCSSFTGTVVADQSEDGGSWWPASFWSDDFSCEPGVKVSVAHDAPLVRLRVAAYVSGSLTVTPVAPADGGAP